MNILFLTLIDFYSVEDRNLYTDLLREFRNHGHRIYIISPVEKRNVRSGPRIIEEEGCTIIKAEIGNIQKTNFVEKGISTITLEKKIIRAVSSELSNVSFDLVLYSTPPITLGRAVNYVRSRDNATTYLLLKDIFPQNAVDIGMISKTGIKGLIYKYFRKKEIKLYQMSDYIGCMSPANVEYLKANDPYLDPTKIEVCPNSIEINKFEISDEEKNSVRKKYNIPLDKTVFIYGGNLGKPQGIDDMIACLANCKDINDSFFLIVGSGTEYNKVKSYADSCDSNHIILHPNIEKQDYDKLVVASDVGLIFLDHRFRIPNFPSRLLSYMQASLPIIAATDVNTDVGSIAEKAGFGVWCRSDDPSEFRNIIIKMLDPSIRKPMGKNSFEYLNDNYSIEKSYKIISKHF